MKKLLLYILLILFLASPAFATIYFSDHITSTWNGSGDPPSPWGTWYNNTGAELTFEAAGAKNGSYGIKLDWPGCGSACDIYVDAGQELIANGINSQSEYYMGFWFKHDAPWNWGAGNRYKLIKYFTGADSTTINMSDGGQSRMKFFWDWPGGSGDTQVIASHASMWADNDAAWHYYIIYVKHNTAGNADGTIQVWVDGTEATYTYGPDASSNTALKFSASSSTFGFSCCLGMGVGNQLNNMAGTDNFSYFDDFIVASTKAEVETFLNVGGGDSTAPVITIDNSDPTYICADSLSATGNATDAAGTVADVEYGIGSDPSGSGTNCTADSAPFDSANEDFTCSTSGYSEGLNTLYIEGADDSANWSTGNSIDVYYDTTAPIFGSASLGADGQTVTVNFTEAISSVNQGSAWANGHWDLDTTLDGTDLPLTYLSGDGTNQWQFQTPTVVSAESTLDIDFDGTANVMDDDCGLDLGAIVSQSVSNGSQKFVQRGVTIGMK